MGRQEQMIVDELLEARLAGDKVPYWGLLNRVARKFKTPCETLRDQFVQLVALCDRLIRERKIVRDRRQRQHNVRLTDYYFNAIRIGNHYGKQSNPVPASPRRHLQTAIPHGANGGGGVGV
jgi:hypothetical protein